MNLQSKRVFRPIIPSLEVCLSFDDLRRVDATLWDKVLDTLLHILTMMYPRHVVTLVYPATTDTPRSIKGGGSLDLALIGSEIETILNIWQR